MRKCLISGVILLFLFSSLVFSGYNVCEYDSKGYEFELSDYDMIDIDNDGWANFQDRDDDGDGLSDSLELGLVKLYSPLLIFDDDEPCDVDKEVVILHQVTPLNVDGDTNYALLSFLVIYPEDYGVDLYKSWWEKISSWSKWAYEGLMGLPLIDYAGEKIGDAYKKIKVIDYVYDKVLVFTGIKSASDFLKWLDKSIRHYHCGDTEPIRFLVYCNNPSKGRWTLKKIIWTRHYDKPYYGGWTYATDYTGYFSYTGLRTTTSKTVRFADYGIGKGKGYHPIIFVSKRKHAMYPDKEFCENYLNSIEFEGDSTYGHEISGVLECPIPLEKCGGGVALMVPTPMQLNVGESYSRNNIALKYTIYDGIDPWSKDSFTGPNPDVYDVDCTGSAGSLGSKWCIDSWLSNLNELPNFGLPKSEGQGIEIPIDPNLLK